MLYEFQLPTRIHYGRKSIELAADLMRAIGAHRVLIVSGRSRTASSPALAALCSSLEAAGVRCIRFPEVEADPSVDTVARGVSLYRQESCDAIIGFGGGSPIDCAKGIAASIGEGLPIERFIGTGRVFAAPVPPLVAIPTTAGTGTEVTNAAVFTLLDEGGTRRKKGTSGITLFPRAAIVDPELQMSMPPNLTAATGMDALTHAVEAYVSRMHTPMSDMFCLESIRLIGRSLRIACQHGEDVEARSDMALAAMYAGVALSQASLGMVHGFAHAAGAMANLPHGLANAILLPYVMESLISDAGTRLAAIGDALTGRHDCSPADSVEAIRELNDAIGIPRSLSEAGVDSTLFEPMLADALGYRRRKASPRDFTDDELREVFARAFSGR